VLAGTFTVINIDGKTHKYAILKCARCVQERLFGCGFVGG